MAKGVKFDCDKNTKPSLDLIPTEALLQIAKVLDIGAKKYGKYNWRKGIEWSRVISASMRHLTAFNDGQDKDFETGLSHIAHLGCNVMFLLTYEKEHKELDDRYKNDQETKEANRTRRSSKRKSRTKKSSTKFKEKTKRSKQKK